MGYMEGLVWWAAGKNSAQTEAAPFSFHFIFCFPLFLIILNPNLEFKHKCKFKLTLTIQFGHTIMGFTYKFILYSTIFLSPFLSFPIFILLTSESKFKFCYESHHGSKCTKFTYWCKEIYYYSYILF
jgi:hypothetical protein